MTGVHRFRDLARMIVAGDPDAIVASCVPADRAITVDLLRRAAGRIAEVAAALNRAAAGEGR